MDVDLMLIHGFWSSPATWERLAARLREDTDLAGLRIHAFGYESPKLGGLDRRHGFRTTTTSPRAYPRIWLLTSGGCWPCGGDAQPGRVDLAAVSGLDAGRGPGPGADYDPADRDAVVSERGLGVLELDPRGSGLGSPSSCRSTGCALVPP